MINEHSYFRAMDAAVLALGFDPYDADANDFTSDYWGLISGAYIHLVQPAVSLLPRQAAQSVDQALKMWAEGSIAGGGEILDQACRSYTRWFNLYFMGLWKSAALDCRLGLSNGLEQHVASCLLEKGFPAVKLELFSLRERLKEMESILRDRALPFMLSQISSFKLPELDDSAPDRRALLCEKGKELQLERDVCLRMQRDTLNEALVTQESIFAFARAVMLELGTQLSALKSSSCSACS